jgi:signal transduction histidine kinase
VIEAQEKERKRIAEDLHDSLGQMLSTIKLHMVSIEDSEAMNSTENKGVLNNAIGYIDDACNEVRNISHHLMPGALIRLGLIPALGDIIENINKTNKVEINFTNNGFEKRLNESTEINIYRIIQELIRNTIKHSQATKIDINMSRENNHISLTIEDNGKGFDTSKISESEGIGWKNIYSRLAILNGKINISSEINRGTKISIFLKMNNEK